MKTLSGPHPRSPQAHAWAGFCVEDLPYGLSVCVCVCGCEGQVVNLVLGRGTASRRVAPPEVGPSTRLGGFWQGDRPCPMRATMGLLFLR